MWWYQRTGSSSHSAWENPIDLLDPRAHVGLADAAIEVGHEDDGGELLDQGAVLGLEDWAGGGSAAADAAARRLAGETWPGERLSRCLSASVRFTRLIVHRRMPPACRARHAGSLFSEAWVNRRSA